MKAIFKGVLVLNALFVLAQSQATPKLPGTDFDPIQSALIKKPYKAAMQDAITELLNGQKSVKMGPNNTLLPTARNKFIIERLRKDFIALGLITPSTPFDLRVDLDDVKAFKSGKQTRVSGTVYLIPVINETEYGMPVFATVPKGADKRKMNVKWDIDPPKDAQIVESVIPQEYLTETPGGRNADTQSAAIQEHRI